MSDSSFEVSKKRKRVWKYFGFHTFGDPGCPVTLNGPFRENIRFFLQQCAEIEDYEVEGMPIWRTFLVYENRGFVVPLYTIEENVKRSLNPSVITVDVLVCLQFCILLLLLLLSLHFVSPFFFLICPPSPSSESQPSTSPTSAKSQLRLIRILSFSANGWLWPIVIKH